MRYLMLVCRESDQSPAPVTAADRDAAPDVEEWWRAADDAGKYVLGDRLRPPEEAVSVRVRGGERFVTEGPFTEASELVSGFDVLDCSSMHEAISIAAGHPMAYGGVIELRAMWPFDDQ
jgi:hypothetical protein